jgi:adenine-specific DNA-methyltransferase
MYKRPPPRPPLSVFTTTLWDYPSMHYDAAPSEASAGRSAARLGGSAGPRSRMQGDKAYAGATPSWVIWQLLQRYTRENDIVLDPMCGSGTTLDVCTDLKRQGLGFDLAPSRPDIRQADARSLPQASASVDFVFVDPPYSTHIDYSDNPRCIGKLDALAPAKSSHTLNDYYASMSSVISEFDRVLRPKRYLGLYVSDTWRKRGPGDAGTGTGVFAPIGFELFAMLREHFTPTDIIAVVRHNHKLGQANWHKAAKEQNYFLRGFNYLFVMKKP